MSHADRDASVLVVEAVTKRLGSTLANDDVSLHVGAGEVFGVLGPNGAGKTTLVSQVLTLRRPDSGRITVAGVDVVADPGRARRACSALPQGRTMIEGLRPAEAVELVGRLRGGGARSVRRRAAELLDELDLGDFAGTPGAAQSGGIARLVGFCMAVVVPGRLVVLDEPTNDVDPARRRTLWAMIRRVADAGSAVLLVTHNVVEAERAVDRLAVLDGGRVLASGTPASLKAGLPHALRLEVTLEPGADAPPVPFRAPARLSGRRLLVDLDLSDAAAAVAWAESLRGHGVAEEFSLAPASLEDAYLRAVGGAPGDRHALAGVTR